MTIYKCEECESAKDEKPCVLDDNDGELRPNACPDINCSKANWQQTDEYEIVKKPIPPEKRTICEDVRFDKLLSIMKSFFTKIKQPFPPVEYVEWVEELERTFPDHEACLKIFKDDEKAQEFIKENLDPKTPNCSICEWKGRAVTKMEVLKNGDRIEGSTLICKSQGDLDAGEVYNSENCKSLFSTTPEQQLGCEDLEKPDKKEEPIIPEFERRIAKFHGGCAGCEIRDIRMCKKCAYHPSNFGDFHNYPSLNTKEAKPA